MDTEKLKKELVQEEEKYYKGNEGIPDELYDFKLRKLQALGVNKAELEIGHSREESDKFKLKHKFPMMSLDNAFNEKELLLFLDSHRRILSLPEEEQIEYFLEPKIDGVSISLHYKDGVLVEAISRGDGKKGENLLQHIQEIDSIPKRINYPGEILIRGEIFIHKNEFREIQEKITGTEGKFINPRSYVAGSLRLKEPEKIREKKLSFIAYRAILLDSGQEEFSSQEKLLSFLRELGFPSHKEDFTLKSADVSEILSFLGYFGEKRNGWEVPNDGLVIKVNSFSLYKQIGSTSKFPKWAIAFKYPSLIKETVLEKITTTVGRSGRITYVGKLTPVYIDGSWINWVSLHNYENIKKLKLSEGIEVQVYKSGEIIPQILASKPTSVEKKLFELITNCPSCNSQLVFKGTNKLQYCLNPLCERKAICKIIFFCSKSGVNIEGLSEGIITKLFQEGIIKNIVDIYSIENKKAAIFNSERLNIKDKSFGNLILSIKKTLSASPLQILSGLGIEYIGGEVAKLLLRKFETIESIFDSTLEEKLNIPGVGPKSAHSIENWITQEENKLFLSQLKKLGFNLSKPKGWRERKESSRHPTHYLSGKTAAITGSFSVSREQIREFLAREYNVEFKDSISKKIDFLLVGDAPGSKLELSRKYNIPIIEKSEVEALVVEG